MPEPLQPECIFAALSDAAVDYVLIGGLAGVLHGSSAMTNDADIVPSRTPTTGYDELESRAVTFTVRGLTVRVAALSDIIRSKETADRPKDQAVLPILYALQEEIAARQRG